MIRVLLAEDLPMLRGALSVLLQQEDDIEVVAELDSGDAVVPIALRERPDVAVLDVGLPGRDGISAAVELTEQLPSCRVLILTGLGKPDVVRRAMAADLPGFMVKDAPSHELATSIRRIAAGERVLDPQLAAAAVRSRPSPLSERETEVLRLMAGGVEPKEIASRLHLSHGTVRNYLASVVTKLDARNRIDAIRVATDAGWL